MISNPMSKLAIIGPILSQKISQNRSRVYISIDAEKIAKNFGMKYEIVAPVVFIIRLNCGFTLKKY